MEEKRRFIRVACKEKVLVELNNHMVSATLINISLNGALVEFENDMTFQQGDRWKIALPLVTSDITLRFGAEVFHRSDTMAGVKFVHTDLDTMIHLRSLI